MKLQVLISSLDCELLGDAEVEVTSITCDSRTLGPGAVPGALFVALPGASSDGHGFIAEAAARGAVAVLAERAEPGITIPQVIVPDARAALASVSSVFYGEPSSRMVVVGITGTNGKTTVAYLLEAIFKEAGFNTGVIGTINYRYGATLRPAPYTTPEAPELNRIMKEMADAGVTHCIMEVSSHALEQKRVDGCRFDATVFTNLTHEHLDYHHTMEEYFHAKSLLFRLLKDDASGKNPANPARAANPTRAARATDPVINMDDPWGAKLSKEFAPVLGFGFDERAVVRPIEYSLGEAGIEASVTTPQGDVRVSSALVGKYNLENILGAIAVSSALSLKCDVIARGVGALKGVPGRLEQVPVPGVAGFRAYVDYAHTGDALERVLDELGRISKGRIITVFGCGGNRDRLKRAGMARAAAMRSTITIITSDNPRDEDPGAIIADIEAGMSGVTKRAANEAIAPRSKDKCYLVIPDRREAIQEAVRMAGSGDTVLVAGKGHEDYQIVKGERSRFNDVEELKAAITTVRQAV
jgi:UDP-N-acetylmuramoyl-L-alanyl-D-glutamate--2,6-diaminopimelate ligase